MPEAKKRPRRIKPTWEDKLAELATVVEELPFRERLAALAEIGKWLPFAAVDAADERHAETK